MAVPDPDAERLATLADCTDNRRGGLHCDHYQEGDGPCCSCRRANWCPDDGAAPATDQAAPVCKFDEGCHRVVPCEPGCGTPWSTTDRATLRERIAAALLARIKQATVSKTQPFDGMTSLLAANEFDLADAVLAVLPAPADRATVQQPKKARPPTAYSDGKGRTYCLPCAPTVGADVPLTINDVDHWDLCPSCGRHVVDVARATEQPKEA